MPALLQGTRINNFILESKLGAGSFGEVWKARHHVFGDVVAIKVPTDPRYVRNLQREGVALHGLRHPNIVRALDLDPFGDPPYFVMEYVDGASLQSVIRQHGADMPIRAAVAILRGTLHALHAAHTAEIVHGDIKPANILISHPADKIATVTEQAVKVTDFGLGRVGGETKQMMVQSGSLLTDEGRNITGTIAYMSPEQREGGHVDARSDLYACGILLYEMLTGERPQGSDLPSALRRDVPGVLDQVFAKAHTRYDRRFTSAQQMLDALAPLSGALPIAAPASSICPRCQAQADSQDQYCIQCGQQLSGSVPRCAACRAYVHPSDRFCIFCGNDLRVLAL